VDWVKVKRHDFDNLICLCAVCHHRATIGEIDRLAMLQYKANLALVTNRYGDLERRCLELAVLNNMKVGQILDLPGGLDIQMWYLLRDGLMKKVASPNNTMVTSGPTGVVMNQREGYMLTEKGEVFLTRWRDARDLEES